MPYTIDLNDEQIDIVIDKYQEYEIPSTNDYTLFRGKIKNNNLTIYQTGKCLIQGKSEEILYKEILDELGIENNIEIKQDNINSNNNEYIPNFGDDTIGSDEVGTGDFFGGIIVCSCLVKGSDTILVRRLGVKDSKQLTDEKICMIAKELMKSLTFEVSLLSPTKYNSVTSDKDFNMNKIKAVMHNTAISKLVQKTNCNNVVLDAFCPKEKYYEYLSKYDNVYKNIIFEEKAENKYLAVACASIIARYYFINYMEKLSCESGYELIKGASVKVDELASIILKEKGTAFLSNYAKMNFKNLTKAKILLNKNTIHTGF